MLQTKLLGQFQKNHTTTNKQISSMPPPWNFYLVVGQRKKLHEVEELPSSASVVEKWFADRYVDTDLPSKPRQLFFIRDGHQVELDDYSAKKLRDGEVLTIAPSVTTPSSSSTKASGSSTFQQRVNNISQFANMINRSYGRLLDDSFLGLVGLDFPQTITQYLKSIEPKPSVTHLLLNANNLTDGSLPSMVNFVPEKFPNLELLDLASNRFTEKANADIVKLMQSLPKLKWIDLTTNSNGLVDINNAGWFQTLSKVGLLQKVIFLPKPWLDRDTWYPMMSGNKKLISVVHTTHKQYYLYRDFTMLF